MRQATDWTADEMLGARAGTPATTGDLEEPKHQVFLVPGFMGFHKLGDQRYFTDVGQAFPVHDWAITRTDTLSTGSLEERTRVLAQEVADHLHADVAHCHFVGHSTGGCDVRMFLAPNSTALEGFVFRCGEVWDPTAPETMDTASGRVRRALARARTALGLATPFRGTPLANVAVAIGADKTFWLAGESLRWRPIAAVVKLGFAGAQRLLGVPVVDKWLPGGPLMESWKDGLLQATPADIVGYFAEMGVGVGAFKNLRVGDMTAMTASLQDRPGVRYGCVVTITPPFHPLTGGHGLTRLTTPVYALARIIAGTGRPLVSYAASDVAALRARAEADRAAGADVGPFSLRDELALGESLPSDGVVPTYSQVHGEVVAIIASDHLDCVGFYAHCRGMVEPIARDGDGVLCPAGVDECASWVRSGSGYSDDRHRFVWGRIAAAMAAASAT